MYEYLFTIVFSVWVLFQAWKGYKQGVWAALLAILGLLIGYAASFFWGQDFAALLSEHTGLRRETATLTAYPVLFIGISQLVRYLPLLVFPKLKQHTVAMGVAGACVGAGSGVVSGLVAVWFVGFISGMVGASPAAVSGVPVQAQAALPQAADPVRKVASRFVAKTTEIGMTVVSGDRAQAKTYAAMVREPEVVIAGVQGLVKSPQFLQLVNSPDTQRMMALNDVKALQAAPEFKALVQQPGMQEMARRLGGDGRSPAESEAFIAEQMTHVWRRLQYVKSDPRVTAITSKPDFQALLQQQNPAALMASGDFQRLVGIVMEGQDMSDVDFTQFVSQAQAGSSGMGYQPGDGIDSQARTPPPPLREKQKIYKWQDQQGITRYSDFEAIPEAFRESAEVFQRY